MKTIRRLTITLALILALVGFNGSFSHTHGQTPTAPPAPATQTKEAHYCGAATKKNTACKKRVKKDGDRCYLHLNKPKV